MPKMRCMMSGMPVELDTAHLNDTLVVTQRGKILGVLSAEALEGVKTVQLTFTRASSRHPFVPVQGRGVEAFVESVLNDDGDYHA